MPIDVSPEGMEKRAMRFKEIQAQFEQIECMPGKAIDDAIHEHGFAIELAVDEARGCPADKSVEEAGIYLLARNCAAYEDAMGVKFEGTIKIFHDNFNAPDHDEPGKYKHRIAWYATSQ